MHWSLLVCVVKEFLWLVFLPGEITLSWSLSVRGSERRLVKDNDETQVKMAPSMESAILWTALIGQ